MELDGLSSVADVLAAINTAGAGQVSATFATIGNGIVLTDTSGGAGSFTVESVNFATVAADLGIAGTTTGTTILGTDVNPVTAKGVFASLLKLRDALAANDQGKITQAGEELGADLTRVIRLRGEAGSRGAEVNARIDRLEDRTVALDGNLAEIEQVDFTEAATRYALLQTTLQANLQVLSQTLDISLLDFLR